jgi:ribosomal protein S6
VDKVQRMGARPFARDTRKRTSGFYVNFIFDAPPKAVAELDAKLHLETEVFRWQFTEMPSSRRCASRARSRPRAWLSNRNHGFVQQSIVDGQPDA